MDNKRVENIKKYMKAEKITYEMLAERAQMSIGTLKSIFSGRTPNPRIDTIEAIEKALNIETPKTVAQSILLQASQLNIADYNSLSEEDKAKIADIFNTTVSAYKKK